MTFFNVVTADSRSHPFPFIVIFQENEGIKLKRSRSTTCKNDSFTPFSLDILQSCN